MLFAAELGAGNWTNAQVAVQSVRTGERRNLAQGTGPRYAESGHLLYAQGGDLMAVSFDLQRLTVTGTAVPALEGVLQSIISGGAQYSLSATGSLVYVPGGAQVNRSTLVWVSRNGTEQPLAAPAHAYQVPRLSPDGRRIAISAEGQVWLYDLSRETLTRFTFEGNANNYPTWTPDGKRVGYRSGSPPSLFWQPADGSGNEERLTTSENEKTQYPNSWSPDGQELAFTESTSTTGLDLWVLRLSDRKVLSFLRTRFDEGAAMFSPDGRWLAYVSDESGRRDDLRPAIPWPGWEAAGFHGWGNGAVVESQRA